MTKPFKPSGPVDAWTISAELLVRWLENKERVDALLDSLPRSLGRTERARCQHLLFGAVRNVRPARSSRPCSCWPVTN
jgi:16S rRNA (cytosine967-C5)-methyltransferase